MRATRSDQRLPPERFYWAVLDTDSLPRSLSSSKRTKHLLYLLEPKLPVPIESVHAVFRPSSQPGGTSQVIACAMTHSELATVAHRASLGPSSAPPFISTDVSQINMLTDRHEPQGLRSQRRNLAVILAAVMVLCSAIILIGVERRVSGARIHAQAIQEAQMDLYHEVLPRVTSTLPPEQRLVAERRQLERTRSSDIESAASIAPSLASLFAAWPTILGLRTQSVILSERGVTINAMVPDHDAAQRLADALDTSPVWETTNPQITTNREGVHARITLERIEDRVTGGTP